MSGQLWHRDMWAEAVWCSSSLKPPAKLVALCYADHAHDGSEAWVALSRLCQRTGYSRDAANRAVRQLEAAGWLTVARAAGQHRSTRYDLTIPAVDNPSSSTGDVPLSDTSSTGGVPLGESSGTPPDTSSTPPDTSSTGGVPDLSSIPEYVDLSASAAHAREVSLFHDKPTAQQLADQWMAHRPLDNRRTVEATVARACDGYPPEVVADGLDRLLAEARTVTPGQLDIAITYRQKERAAEARMSDFFPTTTTQPAICGDCGGSTWLGEDTEGRPIPCRTCRPHLRGETA